MPVPDFVTRYSNLASLRLGAEVVSASDDFFAPKERLIQDQEPVFIPDKYDDHGKWMDGWETRRRRSDGSDHAIIQLGAPGIIHGIDIDTRHFTGNYPPAAQVEAAEDNRNEWLPITGSVALGPDAHHYVPIGFRRPVSRLRLKIFPDGGVARLRVYGTLAVDWSACSSVETELSAARLGARIIAFSDAHFGTPEALLAPGRGRDMSDGWETRRRREPGFDWIIIRLACPGMIERVEVDTAHFKGNYPDRCSLAGAFYPDAEEQGEAGSGTDSATLTTRAMFWPELLSPRKLSADAEHVFTRADLSETGVISHIRLNIHPDGGVSRLRIFGMPQSR